ncbi:Bug family tripartite tricarboxylate transporter substrate binding protein [Halopseudomonas maritima]|uniref:Bug family tripartite tricarboxylate transporter substrate binding protein n=1 Tax=Halopseudomonas maritima TaxID=2918528 RepID=UPI001EEB20E9|nr:tripartite tricarboxylate transporter substrate binding protein [Halopseudomonas maritima]UJJ32231.1 tripartite tricarboxylate transporter substrate binding protein [Halopseudomonas maritima]
MTKLLTTRRTLVRLLTALTLWLPGALAQADAASPPLWPDKPLDLLVGFSPGGGADTLARLVARQLSVELGQPVTVRNIAGGGGIVMATTLRHAEPDGYTIGLAANSAFDGMPTITPLRYQTDDFDYLTTVSQLQNALITSGNAPFANWEEMVAYGREHGLSYGSPSPITRDVLNLVAEREGIRIRFIPMRGGMDVINSLIGGHIDIAWSAGIHQAFLRDGKIRVLASLNAERLRASPGKPAIQELGYPMGYSSYFVLAAPTGLPGEIKHRLSAALIKASQSPRVAQLAEQRMGFPNVVMTPEQITRFIHQTAADYRRQAASAPLN